nr:hypothetical protein [Tanacetum cinerariifolium]
MDDANITIEEYIRLEEERACKRGKVYNWETVTYGKIWDNEDVHDLGSVETKFPAIVFNDTLTSKAALSCEHTLVNISKRRAFWSLKENILKINESYTQYAVSIKEDMAYPYLHSSKTTKETSSIRRRYSISVPGLTNDHKGNKLNMSYPVKTNRPYWKYSNIIFWKISSVVPTPRNSNTSINVFRSFDEVPPKSKNDMPL